MIRRILFFAVVGVGLLGPVESVFGQSSLTSTSVRNRTRNFLFNRPTVSPYVNLASRNTSAMPNYHTLVRPQIEAQQKSVKRQRKTAEIQQQLNIVQNEFRQSQQQANRMMSTGRYGWSSRGMPRFGSTLNYFPGFQRIALRR